uniref:DNA-directed DNA polymerase n=1 Tax=Siphoviridae sp. ctwDi18 TaxID=2827970 RepID=A0A8S5TA73_9CAUD|nr:MAG TPA: activator clamp loader [Siphoviridae sp. ctwDi18]
MAKESLAVKYRPKTFDDMTEQSAIKDILMNQLETKTFQHGYLFTGPAGTGKTTSARIFANMINNGKGNPIEVDAASNSGVDNIRQIIEDAKRKPLDAEYKIFIVDECHSLSNGAWQALLKTLEEPPKFTIFILCTTDPQKIPNTILSRVQRYNFQKISNDGITDRLSAILIMESEEANECGCDGAYDWNAEALEYIAKVSNGGMRDAITLMDKCLSLSSDLTLENVLKTIGGEDYTTFITFLSALEGKVKVSAIRIIETVYNAGKDVKQFMKDFAKFVLEVEKYALYKNFNYISLPNTLENELQQLIDDTLFNVMDFVVSLNNQIKWDSDPKTLIELSILIYCGKE